MNKLSITRSNAVTLACVASITRVFLGVVVDSPELYHSGWISIILGGILSLPLFLCMNHIFNTTGNCAFKNTTGLSTAYGLFSINSLLDGGIVGRCVSSSASYVAFNHAIRFFLLLPLFITILWCLVCGGNATGASARLWIKIFPAFFIVILFSQLSKYRWTWLTPVLGPGTATIIDGAIKAAGWISSSIGILFFASIGQNEDKASPNLLKLLLIIVLSATILTLLRYMMAPGLLSGSDRTRLFQLDIMLTNGRAPLILQLPLIVVWFISLFNLLACDALTAASGINLLFPKLKHFWCSLLSILILLCLSMSRMTERLSVNAISQWQFVANSIGIVLFLIIHPVKGKKESCV